MRPVREGQGAARSKGFTLIELLVVVAIIALLISILLPSLARARELSKRSVCAANLKGMGTGFYTYANESADSWPVALGQKATADGTTVVEYRKQVGIDDPGRGTAGNPARGDANNTSAGAPRAVGSESSRLSTTRNMYRLIQTNVSSGKSFICPSSEDQASNEDNPQDYWDFGYRDSGNISQKTYQENWAMVSYGYQVPYGKVGRPSSDRDPAMPLAADKGPWGAGSSMDGGKTDPDTTKWGQVTASSGPDDWKAFNSPNHGGVTEGEGQNILYADGHAEWAAKPTAGLGSDNIYTRWQSIQGITANHKEKGTQPTSGGSPLAPYAQTDSLIYP